MVLNEGDPLKLEELNSHMVRLGASLIDIGQDIIKQIVLDVSKQVQETQKHNCSALLHLILSQTSLPACKLN